VFKDLDIAAPTAGTIQYASHWRFLGVTIRAEDRSKVAVTNSIQVTGLE
jgi:hypothetical protein